MVNIIKQTVFTSTYNNRKTRVNVIFGIVIISIHDTDNK